MNTKIRKSIQIIIMNNTQNRKRYHKHCN